jgi:uncharacterized protein (DUF1697 family)
VSPSTRYVALLRGVNLGKRRVSMPALRQTLERIGLEAVETYVQSGNAVFATTRPRDGLRAEIEDALAAEFGFEVPAILRTGGEMAHVVAACPYRDAADLDPTKVHATFFDTAPPHWPDADPGSAESYTVGDGVLYMHLPGGMGRARLPTLVERAAKGVTTTTRNWRTVVSLAELARE